MVAARRAHGHKRRTHPQQQEEHGRGDDQRQRSVGADATILHDFKAFLARVAAAEAIGDVGEAVFVEGAGQHRGDGQREEAAEQFRQAGEVGEHQGGPCHRSHHGAHNREHPHRILQGRWINRSHKRYRHAGKKAQRHQE